MKDILARNPELDDVIRRAANRLGENHGLTRDSHGAVIDNQGNSTKYVGSGGQHPSKLNKPKTSKTFGWHRTLNEMEELDIELEEDCLEEGGCGERHEEEFEEATGASSSGSFEGPLFGPVTEQFEGVDKIDAAFDPDYWLDNTTEYQREMGTGLLIDMELRILAKELEQAIDDLDTNEDEILNIYDTRNPLVSLKSILQASQFANYYELKYGESLRSVLEDSMKAPIDIGGAFKDVNINAVYELIEYMPWGRDMLDSDSEFAPGRGADEEELPTLPDEETPVIESIIREEVSRKISKHQLKESLKKRLTRNILNEKDYISGKLKYEKPTKLPGEIKSMPGMKQTTSSLKKSKSENDDYLKQFDKKIKDYLDFEGNSHPEFPHQNNSKTDYKSPMYRNTKEDEEFIEDWRGMGLEDANGVDMLDRVEDYLSGSKETGNAQTDKKGKALGNVVPNKTGEKILKKVKRKKGKIAKQKSKMTNLRGMTPDVQTTTTVKESVEMSRMKQLINYKDTTQ